MVSNSIDYSFYIIGGSIVLTSGGVIGLMGILGTNLIYKRLTKDMNDNDIKNNYNIYLSNFNKNNLIKSNSYLSNFKY